MDPWRRFRLLVCLAVMLGMLGVGGFAWLRWGVPEYYEHPAGKHSVMRSTSADPLDELWTYFYWSQEGQGL
jgi:hypothetical protein